MCSYWQRVSFHRLRVAGAADCKTYQYLIFPSALAPCRTGVRRSGGKGERTAMIGIAVASIMLLQIFR